MTPTGWDHDHDGQQWPPGPANSLGPPAEYPPAHGTRHATSRPRRRRRLIAAVCSAAAVLAIAAVILVVTGSSPGQTPAQAFTAAVRQSANDNTLSADISEQISGSTAASISGTIQAQRKPLIMSMKLAEHVSGGTIPISGILTNSAMYLKLGERLPLPANAIGKWIEFQFARLGPFSSFATLLHDFESENPMSQVRMLLATKDISADGTQNVDGVQATRYTGSFAPSTALKFLPASDRSLLNAALKVVNGNVAVSLWISGGQIVKFTELEHVSSSTVAITIHYRWYNRPLTISVPPASQVWNPSASALSGTS
jgi:hypothetical protein